jgi:hypothetical protein
MPEASTKPALHLPDSAFDDVRLLVTHADKLELIEQGVAKAEILQNVEGMSRHVADGVGLSGADVQSIVSTTLSLYQMADVCDSGREGFVDLLGVWFLSTGRSKGEEALEDAWEGAHPAIRKALDEDSAFAIVCKSVELAFSHQNVLRTARLLTDIRPVYNKGATGLARMVVTHQLVLEYQDGASSERLYLTVDESDLRRLEQQCARARDKAGVLSNSLSGHGWPVSVFGQEG